MRFGSVSCGIVQYLFEISHKVCDKKRSTGNFTGPEILGGPDD